MNETINSLIAAKQAYLSQLADPLSPHKAELLHHIQTIDQQLLLSPDCPYFCSKCKYVHNSGKLYRTHRTYAQTKFTFPDLRPLKIEDYYTMRIVGICSLQTEPLWRKIQSGTKLQIMFERSTQELKICYHKKKIGYIRRDKKHRLLPKLNCPDIHLEIRFSFFHEAEEQIYPGEGLWKCIFCDNHSSGCSKNCGVFGDRFDSRFWRPPYAKITISEFRIGDLQRIVEGLLELHQLGHPDVSGACRLFSPKAMHYVETILLQKGQIALWNQLMQANLFQKIPGSDYELLL